MDLVQQLTVENCTKESTTVRVTLFLTLKLLPITVMFLLLVVYFTQGPILGYIIYCQGQTITVRILQ
jgi:hypothetical protein